MTLFLLLNSVWIYFPISKPPIIPKKSIPSHIVSIVEENFSKRIIKKYYETPCISTIGKELKIHYLIRTFLEKFSNKDYETIFQIIKTSKIENLITIYGDMDFPKAIIFKLLKNPLVFPFLIKFILKYPNIFIKLLKILIK